MKLRILGNSIRLRLGQSEVQRLADGQAVQEFTEFAPANRLAYAIRPADTAAIECTFVDAKITISIPRAELQRWARSADVAIEHTQAQLKLVIEKDLQCGDRRDPDAFPRNKVKP
jgi:hypothetical protein